MFLIILDLVAVFAWEAYERGSDVHLQADPTKLELLHKSFKVKKEDFKEKQGDSILKKVNTWFKKNEIECRQNFLDAIRNESR